MDACAALYTTIAVTVASDSCILKAFRKFAAKLSASARRPSTHSLRDDNAEWPPLRLISHRRPTTGPSMTDAGVCMSKLYVGNLPFETTEADLQAHFAQAGTVESVNVMRDRETGRARGFAFVEMASQADTQAAITQFNDQAFGGRRLTVNEARPQEPRTGGFGGGGGGGGYQRQRREPRW
jgi:cold-inducible RNA-binding protein